jgi:glutamate synthase domain-containing protein 2
MPTGRPLGQSRIFTPGVMDDIHTKAELGRYRMRGFSMFKPIPHWDELMFMPGTLTRFVIEGYREKCDTKTVLGARYAKNPIELDIPIYITGMSFGALSLEAKMALAKGASMAGTATCSGEGGMIPPERDLSTKWYYQVIQSRYGFNPHHLMLADAIEFFIGQGCKVGLGGHLMGQKVTEQVAEMRSLPAGIDQRSPARHPDWLGPDDLSLKIQEIKCRSSSSSGHPGSMTTYGWLPNAGQTSSTWTAPRAVLEPVRTLPPRRPVSR